MRHPMSYEPSLTLDEYHEENFYDWLLNIHDHSWYCERCGAEIPDDGDDPPEYDGVTYCAKCHPERHQPDDQPDD
jgi:hypothetical protein